MLDIESALSLLTKSLPDFQEQWDKYVSETYENYQKERLDYMDISEHARFIRDGILANKMDGFEHFFDTVENILNNGDSIIEDFIVVGLLESIQHNCSGDKINIWTGFDIWLKPKTKKHWDRLINTWEGNNAIEKFKAKHPNNNILLAD